MNKDTIIVFSAIILIAISLNAYLIIRTYFSDKCSGDLGCIDDNSIANKTLRTDCINDDDYCPKGCLYETDKDCPPMHECNVNDDCNDNNPATKDECLGIPRECKNTLINSCIDNDNYCPDGCVYDNDKDCKPSFNVPYKTRVIVLKYFPTSSDGTLDLSETGDWQNPSLDALRSRVSELNSRIADSLEEGSTYHGYKDSDAEPYLDYYILEEIEYLRQIKVSAQYPTKADQIKELNDIDICDYVDNKGVKQVWVWMSHNAKNVPIESNMVMGRLSKAYWNYGDYGDISNSARINDLPICDHTYVVYEYNYGRGLGEALEDHGHHYEAVFNFIDWDLFWNKFVGDPATTCEKSEYYRCGWSHSPPNVYSTCPVEQYAWTKTNEVLSDCEDWNPDGTGEKNIVSCKIWTQSDVCSNIDELKDGNSRFKIWWMQNMPGYNNGLAYKDKKMRNWWEFIADFDEALAKGKGFTEE